MRRILSYLRPYAMAMALGLLIKFVGTIMDLLLPWILAHVIDDVVPTGSVAAIYLWGVAMLACSGVAVVGNVVANRMASRVSRDATRLIRRDLFAKITRLSSRQMDAFTTPSLISRLTSDTYNMNAFLGRIQRLGVRAPILLLGGVTVTLLLDVNLSLVLLSTLPLLAAGIVFISRKGVPLYGLVREAGDRMVRVVRDNVTGIRVIKALSRTGYEKQRFAGINEELSAKETHASSFMAATNPLMNLLLNLGLTGVIVAGAFLVQANRTEPGKIIAFLTYFTIILNALLSVNRMFVLYSQASASAARIEEVLLAPEEEETPSQGALPPMDTGDHIRFEDVSFSYSGQGAALSHISFSIGHGRTLGVMGATGSGKTTLMQLLQRFYPVDSGVIRIDGRDVRAIPADELHRMFGVAFQSDAFFADTILENIDLGRGLPREQIERAARCAQAAPFIEALPDGYAHTLTAKATNLSGGQRQRLLIARALAGNPQILILDDSSSALDYRTDAALRSALRTMYPDTTTVLIAQRVSTVRRADLILVLEEGEAVGLGTHEELMRTCEPYRETALLQMGGEDDAAQG
ncbi:MAG TPA: ABC transporter ATP-binding protein [Candidatus Onthenecus intestinigallinarum]|uniref:ABC transporter ATP-binding protein n=1 Tax=Candidatus Onthenecus intestinigallinarum TaxID=2840875 RepID=A0A9D0Z9E2_9FIRM|nr:ABC transporter ATP-binding protein [Candidatus Onthenecus intestinigallinarum]